MNSKIRFNFTQENLNKLKNYLFKYFKNPMKTIQKLPDWNWGDSLIVIFLANLIFNILLHLFLGDFTITHFFSFTLSIFQIYITSIIFYLILSGLLYYIFFFTIKKVNFQKLYILIITASLPQYFISSLTPFLEFFGVLGTALTAMLIIIGASENFQIPRLTVSKIIGVLFAIYFISWSLLRIAY